MVISGQRSATTTDAVVADARAFDNMTATTTDAVAAAPKYFDSDGHFVIYAPAGRLGLVMDSPDECGPVVYIVKENSVLIDQIKVGDRLIGVDDIDVRSFTAIKVSKLMSRRRDNPVRKLTLTRGTPDVDDDEVSIQVNTDTQGESDGMAPITRRVGVVDAMSYSNGGVAASTIDETKTTEYVTAAETKVGEEKGETPMKKSVDP
jgi:C-terminal processing protease CtpA/Prc